MAFDAAAIFMSIYYDIKMSNAFAAKNPRSITEQFILIGTMNMFLRCVFFEHRNGVQYELEQQNE